MTDNTHGYVYDAENRLTCVQGTDGTCTSSSAMNYVYNALGQRAEKLQGSAGAAQVYTYDMQGQVLGVHDGSGNLLRSEFYTMGRHVGVFVPGTGAFNSYSDWLGTERVRVQYNGNILAQCTDTPFGMNTSCTSSPPSPIQFAAMEYDGEDNQYHTLFRQYEPPPGRWNSPDPLAGDVTNPQSLNRYAYALNNPTTLTDPTGQNSGCTPAPSPMGGYYPGSFINCPSPGSMDNYNPNGTPEFGNGGDCVAGGGDPIQCWFGESTGPGGGLSNQSSPGYQFGSELAYGQQRYLSIIATGWDPTLGINWNFVSGPSDPGCGPTVVGNINATIGSQYGLTFSQVGNGPGTEKGGNWDYTLQSNPVASQAAAQSIADQINVGNGIPPGTRGGSVPSAHAPSASWANVGTDLAPVYVVQINGAHTDTINPNIGLAGMVGHGVIDYIFGPIIQNMGGSLGCH